MGERRVDSQNKDRLSAQTIFQWLCAMNTFQLLDSQGQANDEDRKKYEETKRQLLRGIERWGGVSVIDEWLLKNDPGHNIPSGIKELDWSWLPEYLRPAK